MKKIMIISLYILGTFFLIWLIGKIVLHFSFDKQVKAVFSPSKKINQTFHFSQLEGLPTPVQRYFKHVLKENQPYISYVRIKHNGQFKIGLDKDWVDIKGEQYFATQTPAYIWKGTTAMFVARDMFIADKGRLIATLFSLINVVDSKGISFDEGELQRWVSESVWFPTNLLPNDRLTWTTIDDNSAKLNFKYLTISFSYMLNFNELGEITQMQTQRFMTEKSRETWLIKLSDYEELNGIIVPKYGEVIWRLEKGDYSYAKFKVQKIEYDIPNRF
jgi:hypothetical protein